MREVVAEECFELGAASFDGVGVAFFAHDDGAVSRILGSAASWPKHFLLEDDLKHRISKPHGGGRVDIIVITEFATMKSRLESQPHFSTLQR